MSRWQSLCVYTVIGLFLVHACIPNSIAAEPSSDPLGEMRQTMRTVRKLSTTLRPASTLLEVVAKSRWRYSISEVVRILVASPASEDRIIGWRLAQERNAKMEWTEDEIQKVLAETDVDVKEVAMASITDTDPLYVARIVEAVLHDPKAAIQSKKTCVSQLPKVPQLADRTRLWILAANNDELRQACLFTFPSVSESDVAIRMVSKNLDDKTGILVAISDHLGTPQEARVMACQVLSTTSSHKQVAIQAIQQRFGIPPAKEDLRFFMAAAMALHTLDPNSLEPEKAWMRWYEKLPTVRGEMLQNLASEPVLFKNFEARVIGDAQKLSPEQKYCLCQWLSGRKSEASKDTLRQLLSDPHPGVRIAAAIGLAKADPLFDLAPIRENLLAFAESSPEEFTIAFKSISEAVATLALAGQSDEQAINWLRIKRTPELNAPCEDALQEIILSAELSGTRSIPWKSVSGL